MPKLDNEDAERKNAEGPGASPGPGQFAKKGERDMSRYIAELTDGLSTHYTFSYIDTEDNLAALVFDHLKVDAEVDAVFQMEDDDPYRVVIVKIPRAQREAFLRAADLLPSFMAYAGKTDYEDYCREFFTKAARWLKEKETTGRSVPLQ